MDFNFKQSKREITKKGLLDEIERDFNAVKLAILSNSANNTGYETINLMQSLSEIIYWLGINNKLVINLIENANKRGKRQKKSDVFEDSIKIQEGKL